MRKIQELGKTSHNNDKILGVNTLAPDTNQTWDTLSECWVKIKPNYPHQEQDHTGWGSLGLDRKVPGQQSWDRTLLLPLRDPDPELAVFRPTNLCYPGKSHIGKPGPHWAPVQLWLSFHSGHFPLSQPCFLTCWAAMFLCCLCHQTYVIFPKHHHRVMIEMKDPSLKLMDESLTKLPKGCWELPTSVSGLMRAWARSVSLMNNFITDTNSSVVKYARLPLAYCGWVPERPVHVLTSEAPFSA